MYLSLHLGVCVLVFTHPGGWLRKECLSAVPVFTLYVPPCPDLSCSGMCECCGVTEEIRENLLYGEIRPLPHSQVQLSLEVWSLWIASKTPSDGVETLFSCLRKRIYT